MNASLWDYIELCKPRVVLLMMLTAVVGMCLAPSDHFPWEAFVFGSVGIALVASSAAVLNHIADVQIDKLMRRTQNRPIVKGKISLRRSLVFATTLCVIGMIVLMVRTNYLTAALTFLSLIGYAIGYTLFLKHATPQNIVIGGIAGAAPPLLGWAAVTNTVAPQALLLVLIIYVWTPPHFWALAIHRLEDYAKANVPMLPHTHGVAFTKLNILLYTLLLICISIIPYLITMSGAFYLIGVMVINLVFLYAVLQLYFNDDKLYAIRAFRCSIYYLGILFLLLLIDHYLH